MPNARLVSLCAVCSVLLFPFAAWAWVQGDPGTPRPWWAWLAVAVCVAAMWFAWWRAFVFVRDEESIASEDRRVWRSWLLTAGPLAVPLVVRAVRRRETVPG